MTRVKVNYFGLLRNTVGRQEEEIEVPDRTCVRDVLKVLVGKYGNQFEAVVFRADGSLRPPAMVLVDGKDIRDFDGLDTKLAGASEIFLAVGIYPVAGG